MNCDIYQLIIQIQLQRKLLIYKDKMTTVYNIYIVVFGLDEKLGYPIGVCCGVPGLFERPDIELFSIIREELL